MNWIDNDDMGGPEDPDLYDLVQEWMDRQRARVRALVRWLRAFAGSRGGS